MKAVLLTTILQCEQDVVPARQRSRKLAAMLGIGGQQQTALATAVSEIARNAMVYGGAWARVEYGLADSRDGSFFRVTIADRGKGIQRLDDVLNGLYQSNTGMGLGIIGSRRLCDEFEIESAPQSGTRVTLGIHLPKPITAEQIASISAKLAQEPTESPLDEMRHQNRELLTSLEALMARQAEVDRLNAELSETNRGVLALYAELDEQAASLRRVNDYKSRFLSDMTHELRTPLNAMISLSRLLLDHVDGDLNAEQQRQVTLINRSATNLGEMVNDLLDLAKIESGKTDIHAEPFTVAEVFATLRGMFRPLFSGTGLTLTIDEPPVFLTMVSDEQKLSQILRNLVSNAMKFTVAGEVRVSANVADGGQIEFVVTDTGIGIAPEHVDLIFQDYSQLDGEVQRRQKGTGLGLPLTRKLATLLGGTVSVDSVPGAGSTFTVRVPMTLQAAFTATPSREMANG